MKKTKKGQNGETAIRRPDNTNTPGLGNFDTANRKSIPLMIIYIIMHQSFVIPAPTGPGISGAFNFSVFKALLNALHCGDKFMVKSLLKAPAPRRLKIMKNNK